MHFFFSSQQPKKKDSLRRLLKIMYFCGHLRELKIGQSIQEWTSKICGRQPLKTLKRYGLLDMICLRRSYPFKLFKGCPPQIFFGPLLNTSSQIIHQLKTAGKRHRTPSAKLWIFAMVHFEKNIFPN